MRVKSKYLLKVIPWRSVHTWWPPVLNATQPVKRRDLFKDQALASAEDQLSANLFVQPSAENSSLNEHPAHIAPSDPNPFQEHVAGARSGLTTRFYFNLKDERPSSWSQSGLKRLFDVSCVFLAMPFLLPIFLVVGLAIRVTSRGPVLFLQTRIGRHRRTFTILKFRTMEHREQGAHNCVTTTENQRFTPVGPFLRRWKLDELPQVFNVLMGDMSLVGPRPKIPEHQIGRIRCRPGITGAATIAFAREEQVLATLTDLDLDSYYRSIILPAKLRLDIEYMSCATFLSDLKLITNTALRRWDTSAVHGLIEKEIDELRGKTHNLKAHSSGGSTSRLASLDRDESLVSGD